MLSDVPLMAYLGWNWIPFPNGLLIACFWFYRLLQLTRNSSDCRTHTCDLPEHICTLTPTCRPVARHHPEHLWGAQGRSCTQFAPLPWYFLEQDPPFSQFLEGDHMH